MEEQPIPGKAGPESWTQRLLAAAVLVMFFATLAYVLKFGVQANSETAMLMIGTLIGALQQAFQFFFGSSTGSKSKEQKLLG